VRYDVTKSEAIEEMSKGLKDGAIGLGEIKFHVALDGPEMRRVYELAADAGVPVTVHFQEVPHFDGEGVFNTGFPRLGSTLKEYPKTTILGDADAFWANVGSEVPKDVAYPSGPLKQGRLTDRWLSEFPNIRGYVSQLLQQLSLPRSRIYARVSRTASGQAHFRQRLSLH
jgi:hypothetical protein